MKKVAHFTSRDAMLRMIVGRCHVGASNKDVFKYVISRMANKWETFVSMDRESRKRFFRAIRSIHADNRNLYQQVMGR